MGNLIMQMEWFKANELLADFFNDVEPIFFWEEYYYSSQIPGF